MWVAILSDVHGNEGALRRVLADARAHSAEVFVNLGDLGNGTAHSLLAEVRPRSVAGNWEVSSWRALPEPWRGEVSRWPFLIVEGPVVYCHASPVWPAEVQSLEDAARYVREKGSWFALFPDLNKDEDARWEAFARLAEMGARIAFHGHTHIQKAWVLTPDNRMRPVNASEFALQEGALYLVGIGSVGHPLDGPGACYALWHPQEQRVLLRRLPE